MFPLSTSHLKYHIPQVALRILRNESAVKAEKMNEPYDRKRKRSGRQDFIAKQHITKVTPEMIAYAAIQVCPSAYLVSVPINPPIGILWAVIHGVMEGNGWVV